ncbi:alpha/beta fold hydrolase [Oceaniglobus indicus]|uniref:alpha/beta fold hydrolase n=1 Tax=Oceaniglobus indicus TaxID=2047749 RepID=UPI000C17F324|nr:alpha/beta fold hydrolase [Oceaniglobus indicus]
MGLSTITLPRLGETMEEAKVTDWLVAPGTAFQRGDVLLEVETDKTVVEVPALKSGTMARHLVAEGDTVALGDPIAEIETDGPTETPQGTTPTEAPGTATSDAAESAPAFSCEKYSNPTPIQPLTPEGPTAASPRARRLAKRAGLALDGITGTGRRGRITGDDVEAARGGRAAAASRKASDRIDTPHGAIALRRLAPDAAGAPVLMLHGLFDHGRGWRDLPDRIAAAGHPVLVPDLPGHGDSDAMETLEIVGDALARLVPEGPVILVGHSLGAVLATRIARAIGPRALRLILLAPAGLGPRINADFLDVMGHAATPEGLARGFALLGAGPVSATVLDTELTRLKATRPAMLALSRQGARDGVQQTDIAPDLARLSCPVTAIFGLDDRVIRWTDCAACPPRTAIHLIPDAGHLPHLAEPDLVTGLIADPGRENVNDLQGMSGKAPSLR